MLARLIVEPRRQAIAKGDMKKAARIEKDIWKMLRDSANALTKDQS